MGTVSIQNAVKNYGAVKTIKGVSVDVPDGSFTVLVGPSGCGKSTLLRMIAGLEEIDGGTVSIDDRVINEIESKERDIAMVFQNYALYPHMTVEKNMGFSLWLAKTPKDEIRQRVAEAARILDLSPYLDRYPRQLSGGQRQRVAMGRAMVREPKVYLFDEPLSNLDAKLRVQMRSELRAMHKRLRTTTIYVTHDQIEAMTMADQIVVMRAGMIEQVGNPLDLYDRPANTFVAGFIGSPSMNLIPAVADGAGNVQLAGGPKIAVGRRLATGQQLILGIRPEHLEIGSMGADPEAVVVAVEPTGANTTLEARMGTVLVTADLRSRVNPTEGEPIALRFPPEALHFFDAASEQRIDPEREG